MLARVALLSSARIAATAGFAEEARFAVERYRPAIDGSGAIDVDSGDVGEHLQISAGAFSTTPSTRWCCGRETGGSAPW